MSFRKIAILTGTIGLLVSPAFAQSVQDSNTYPDSVPDTPQAGNLRGQQDFDTTGPTGAILVPVPAPYLERPGYGRSTARYTTVRTAPMSRCRLELARSP